MEHTYAVIMAGGVGSRFWPTSTSQRPKQFLDILGTGESLLQQTFRRMERIVPADHIYIVTHTDYVDQCLSQLPKLKMTQILAEPARRNTAPCVAYAAFKLKKRDPLANIVLTPADHLVTREEEFERMIKHGLKATQKKNILLTLGITPHRPETGYGYIQFKNESTDLGGGHQTRQDLYRKTQPRLGRVLSLHWRIPVECGYFYLECQRHSERI
jgi:mannose-1-phosphate guanylyltransferase